MNRGDIVLTLFPFSNLNTVKCRPALIISNTAYNKKSKDVVVIAMSSKTEKKSSHDVLIRENDKGFSGTGLRKSSLIKVDKIIHVEKSVIRRKLGIIDFNVSKEVDSQLKKLLSL